MKAAFYSGASGLIAHQEALNTIGHNIANVDTTGYKTHHNSFDELLYTRMYVNTPEEANTGHGVRAGAEPGGILFLQGSFSNTGDKHHFAISGDAFFAVEGADGQPQYTRDGAFTIAMEGSSAYLTAGDGSYILDTSGSRITVPVKESEGDAEIITLDLEAVNEMLGLYTFANPSALAGVSSTRFAPTANSGEAEEASRTENKVLQGYLERSSVDLADEMTKMIAAQRSYQVAARVVQTADQLEEISNSLRG